MYTETYKPSDKFKFNVGDKVRVIYPKNGVGFDCSHDGCCCYFNQDMRDFIGDEFIIELIEGNRVRYKSWEWCEHYLELADEEKIIIDGDYYPNYPISKPLETLAVNGNGSNAIATEFNWTIPAVKTKCKQDFEDLSSENLFKSRLSEFNKIIE